MSHASSLGLSLRGGPVFSEGRRQGVQVSVPDRALLLRTRPGIPRPVTNPQRIQSTPPVQCVRSARTLSASLVLLLLLPGCTTPLGEDQETEGIDCEMEPTTEGCFEPVVTEDDCTPTQVFTGESCRIMLRPEKLDFGTSEATLQIGTEMQQLTPASWETHPGMGSKSSATRWDRNRSRIRCDIGNSQLRGTVEALHDYRI